MILSFITWTWTSDLTTDLPIIVLFTLVELFHSAADTSDISNILATNIYEVKSWKQLTVLSNRCVCGSLWSTSFPGVVYSNRSVILLSQLGNLSRQTWGTGTSLLSVVHSFT